MALNGLFEFLPINSLLYLKALFPKKYHRLPGAELSNYSFYACLSRLKMGREVTKNSKDCPVDYCRINKANEL